MKRREPHCDLEKSIPIPEMAGLKFKMTVGYLVSDRRQMPEAPARGGVTGPHCSPG